MKQPYFSIVIPTKNRPDMVYDAIASALWQDFEDMEVIVSDNYNDERTKATVDRFNSHRKLKYIRTSEELNMLNHWEWASKHANGKYVLILPDRKVLVKGALRKLAEATVKYPEINAFSYHVSTYDEQNNTFMWSLPTGRNRTFDNAEMIKNFLTENLFRPKTYDYYFPKTLNGFYKSTYAQQVREEYGQYFNTPGVTTPDYSSFFINMALNERTVYVGNKILISQGEQVSNGRNFGQGKVDAYLKMLGLSNETLYSQVPVKTPFIYNWLIVDFLTIQKNMAGNIKGVEVDWINYYATLYYEMGFKLDSELIDDSVKKYFSDSWSVPFAQMSKGDQEKINNRIKSDKEITLAEESGIRKIKNIKAHLRDFASSRLGTNHAISGLLSSKYNSTLHAAGYKVPSDGRK